jgi:hypothetical protein
MNAAQQRTPKVDVGDGGICKGNAGQGLVHLVVLVRNPIVRKINRLKLAWYVPVGETHKQNQKSKISTKKSTVPAEEAIADR